MSGPSTISLSDAAGVLNLPIAAVEALIAGGYLGAAAAGADAAEVRTISMIDLKSFMARNGVGDAVDAESIDDVLGQIEGTASDPALDPGSFLSEIGARSADMADQALGVFTAAVPEARHWDEARRHRFVGEAIERFDAIIAVARLGDAVDGDLLEDLEHVGTSAAMTGSPLPEVLLTLRVSRDLLVQTAVRVSDDRGRAGPLALSIVLTHILPAMDRLTDAVARGYWSAVVRREEENSARYEHVVEHSSDGVYEIDTGGRFTYANPSFAVITGVSIDDLHGADVADVIVPADPDDPLSLFTEQRGWRDVAILRADGVIRRIEVKVGERLEDGQLVGHDGVVRDRTSERELEEQKNDFLAFVTHELRQPVSTVLGLGITLSSHAEELPAERVRSIGTTLRRQAERMARLAEDLFDISRIEANSLTLNPSELDVAETIANALASVSGTDDVEVAVEPGLEVRADPRRLEKVLAHLVENAVQHGAAPVRVSAIALGHQIQIRVLDHGDGLQNGAHPALFDHLDLTSFTRRHDSGPGLGLPLARGLLEAMGGRVRYEEHPAGGAVFVVTVPAWDVTG